MWIAVPVSKKEEERFAIHRKTIVKFIGIWYNIGNRKVGGLNEKKQDIAANEEMPISEEMVVSYVSALRKVILKENGGETGRL